MALPVLMPIIQQIERSLSRARGGDVTLPVSVGEGYMAPLSVKPNAGTFDFSDRLVRARIAWLPLPRESPSRLIVSPRLVDSMWYFAYASNMNRRQIEARVQCAQ